MASTVMWFRRDLRLSDNPALLEALRTGDEVVPLYVIDERLWGPAGDNRRAFLVGCLNALDDQLGGRLVVRHGDPATVVADVAREVEAPWVFAAEDFGPYGRRRDDAVAQALAASAACALTVVGSPYAVPPGELRTGKGDPFKVFSPFRRAWRDHGWADPLKAPGRPTWAGVRSDGVPRPPEVTAALPDPGEAAAKAAARRFWDARLPTYATDRNQPGADRTSRLSPYLRWGCLHPRQLLARLGDTKSESTFRSELCWREFYADVLFHRPDTVRQSFNPAMRAMRVDGDERAEERFDAWAAGRTGYPIVDAGMRQLRSEGWMHNRVRMIVASFLVKDLHVDWVRGAQHFMQHLVDGDLASNTHGWQWTAGTGTDPAPYFRIFNPVSQAQRFDPDGTYVRRHVPELTGVRGAAVHEPWLLADGPPEGYAAPIVDHKAEREEALRRYADVRRTG